MMPSLLDRLKIPVLTVFISLILFFALVKLFGPIPFSVNSINTEKSDMFTVDGTGEAVGKPDTAQFTVGVTKTGSSVDETQSQTNTAVNNVIAALKNQGIEDKDIKTDDYSVNPNIDFSTGSQRTNGYTVSTNVTVKVKDSNKANAALDAATKNGANIVNGVSFTVNDDERKELEDKARADAIKEAKDQAAKISKQAGIRLGRVTNIVVNPTTPGPIMYDKAMNAAGETAPRDATQLQPGENKVTVTVTLYYETL
jgi:uncharacterized protein YggE